MPDLGEAYYIPWRCSCCGRENRANDSCDCTQKALRSDPMDLSAVRLCSSCGKCSHHCPQNHTHLVDGGWGVGTVRLVA